MKKIYFLLASFLVFGSLYAQTYCNPSFSSGCVFNNYISSVSVGGLNNSASGCSTWDYTSKKATIKAGDTINMTVKMAGWDGVAVFCDLNNDGDMTDVGEKLFSQYTANTPPITYNFTITVPLGTSAGNHRFRVNCGNGGSASGAGPCVSTSYGNHHDYTLEVTNNCPSDSNLQVTNITPNSADFSWASRSVQQYQYVLDTNAQDPTTGFANTPLTNVSLSGLTDGQQYYFHIRSDCGNGIYSKWGSVSFVACDIPNASITPSSDVGVCRGDTVDLTIPLDTAVSYQWYLNGGKMIGQTQNFLEVGLFPGRYKAFVERYKGCSLFSDEIQVSIYAVPDPPTIGASGNLVFTEGGFATYDWYRNDTFLITSADSTYLATINGSYHVVVQDTNGCEATSKQIGVFTAGLDNPLASGQLAFYPNPSDGQIYVENNRNEMVDLRIYSMDGSLRMRRNVYSGAVDLSELKSGIYIIQLNGTDSLTRRLLIE